MNLTTIRERIKALGGPGSGWTREGGHVAGGGAGWGGKMPKESAKERRGIEPTNKDSKRISDIIKKSNGSMYKAHDLAHQMANAITSPEKAKRRAYAASDLGHSSIAEIFHNRHANLIGRAASLNTLRERMLAKFQEGDSVIVIESGDEGTVVGVDNGEYDVEDDNGDDLGTFLGSELRATSAKRA